MPRIRSSQLPSTIGHSTMEKLSVVEVTHTMIPKNKWHDSILFRESWSLTPSFALVRYLRENRVRDFVLALHHSDVSESFLMQGTRKEDYLELRKPRNLALTALAELVFTIVTVLRSKKHFDLYVGVDALNTISGLILRRLGFVQRVVFYAIDYAEVRFANPVMNWIYHKIDLVCTRYSDGIWNLSDRMNRLRIAQGVTPDKTKHVPVGLYPDKDLGVRLFARRLIYFGMIDEYKGIVLAVKAMKTILAHVPDAKLVIMGGGPLLPEIRSLVARDNLQDAVSILGYVSYEKASEVLREGGIGIAPFQPSFISKYADPEKIKDYIRFGCPVVMTDAPEVHKEIRERAAGIVVRYDMNEFAEAAIRLITDADLYEKLSKNAVRMAQDYKWDGIYEKAFMDIGLLPSRSGPDRSD